jgi:hypothetical protein
MAVLRGCAVVRVVSFVILVLACLMPDLALAAKKKSPAPPPKPIYEAPMRVVIVRSSMGNCEPLCPEWIAAEGEITPATPQAFRKVFKQMGKKKLPIIIRSPGGSIGHALEIGRMIRKRGLDIAVGATTFSGCAPDAKSCKLPKENNGIYRGTTGSWFGFCNSACPLVVAGGKERLIGNDVQIGVHKPKTIWNNERIWYRETYRIVNGKKKIISRKIARREKLKPKVTYGYDKRLRKQLTAYLKEMGIDPAIIAESEDTAHKDIKNLKAEELDTYRLRTSTGSPSSLSNPALCTDPTRQTVCIVDEDKSTTSQKTQDQRAMQKDPPQTGSGRLTNTQ